MSVESIGKVKHMILHLVSVGSIGKVKHMILYLVFVGSIGKVKHMIHHNKGIAQPEVMDTVN